MPPGPIALCYGTRPQVIKASVLRRELARLRPVIAIDTGQHYDYELDALLYRQLSVSPPDATLEVGSGGHAAQTAAILTRAEALFQRHRPEAVVVIGDTNSTLGCALAAAKLRLPVVHVEAGLRAGDSLMPEEINRRMVDAIASLLCTPSHRATARVRAERCDAIVRETGDVALDVLLANLSRLPPPAEICQAAASGPYCFATLHRAELTDRPTVLRQLLATLAELDWPVVLALHPRTRAALDGAGALPAASPRVTVVPPVGYLESLALTRSATIVLTDSGGLQREAYWLGVPCITVRSETEWTETLEAGANLTLDPGEAEERLAQTARSQVARWPSGAEWDRSAYGDGSAARQIRAAVASLLGES